MKKSDLQALYDHKEDTKDEYFFHKAEGLDGEIQEKILMRKHIKAEEAYKAALDVYLEENPNG